MWDQHDGNDLQPAERPSLAAQAHLSYFGHGVANVEGHGCFVFAVLEGGAGEGGLGARALRDLHLPPNVPRGARRGPR